MTKNYTIYKNREKSLQIHSAHYETSKSKKQFILK